MRRLLYEITARSDQDCEDPSGEPVAPLIRTEPQAWRSTSDVRVCAGQQAAPRPTATPASNLPDTATAGGMSDAAGLSVMIVIAAVLMLVGSVVLLLPRPR